MISVILLLILILLLINDIHNDYTVSPSISPIELSPDVPYHNLIRNPFRGLPTIQNWHFFAGRIMMPHSVGAGCTPLLSPMARIFYLIRMCSVDSGLVIRVSIVYRTLKVTLTWCLVSESFTLVKFDLLQNVLLRKSDILQNVSQLSMSGEDTLKL